MGRQIRRDRRLQHRRNNHAVARGQFPKLVGVNSKGDDMASLSSVDTGARTLHELLPVGNVALDIVAEHLRLLVERDVGAKLQQLLLDRRIAQDLARIRAACR